jgi:periplasmic divalent cation tolerance protein
MAAEDRPVLVMVTTGGRDDAERLAEGLVSSHLAASCSVVPMVHSVFYSEGRLQREHESLLLVKTVESRAEAAQEFIRGHHSYDVPEILKLGVDGGSPKYLQWLSDQVSQR